MAKKETTYGDLKLSLKAILRFSLKFLPIPFLALNIHSSLSKYQKCSFPNLPPGREAISNV